MSVEALSTAELLSAYVIDDVNRDERSAVELWLKSDPAARALATELRALCTRLKTGQMEASASLLLDLRRTIENIPTICLISAYVIGDIAPGERAKVQRLLDASPHLHTAVVELRALCDHLKAGQVVASESIADTLRNAINEAIRAKQLHELVALSVTGDITASEKRDVQTYCATHPEAAAEQRHIAAMSLLLNAGQRVASAAHADTLRQRLSAVLPAGAMVPKAPVVAAPTLAASVSELIPITIVAPVAQATTTTPSGRMPATSQSDRQLERPSLRVFVAPENPWKKRAWVMGSVAAAVALAFGLRNLVNRPGATGPSVAKATTTTPTIHADQQHTENSANLSIVPGHDAPVVKAVPEHAPVTPRINKLPDAIAHDNAIRPPKAPGDDPVAPAPVIAENNGRDVKTPDATTAGNVPVVKPNAPIAPAPDANVATQNPLTPLQPAINPNPTISRNTNGNGGGDLFNNLNALNGNGQGVASVVPPVAPPTPPTPAPTNDNNKIPPQDGAGVVGVVKGTGLAQATTPTGAIMVLKTQGAAIPSGSTIVTDDAHLSLVLPGNGRLYISRFANLKVTFARNTTFVTLNNGELYYIAPSGGSLTVNAVKATASRVMEGDVSLAAGKLTALNFSTSPLTLSASKQPSLSVFPGIQASTAADASAAPKRDPLVTLNGLWRSDVLISGDGIKALIQKKVAVRSGQ